MTPHPPPDAQPLAPAPLVIWHDPSMLDHMPGHEVRGSHPERPDRLRAALGALGGVEHRRGKVPLASASQLRRVHTQAHVASILALEGRSAQIDPDTGISPGSVRAALLAAGAAMRAAELAMTDPDQPRHFCLVRPPGHHAEPGRAMGFCLLSNLALAAETALEAGARRVMVVDFDVHHGNGTAAAFAARDDVLVVDLHQDGHYPGTGVIEDIGVGAGRGYTINLPLPPGSGDARVLALFRSVVVPAARSFAPDLLCVAAGFDAHALDPLGDLRLSDEGYLALARGLRALADGQCGGRLVATLEGGYDLEGLAGGVGACARAWSESPPPADREGHPDPLPDAIVGAMVKTTRALHPALFADVGPGRI